MSASLQPYELYPTRLLHPWDFPGKNTGVGCHFLLQGIFPTQGSNPHLLHWQVDFLPLNHLGSPNLAEIKSDRKTLPIYQRLYFLNLLSQIFAAAANLLQSCPTLCDPIDGSSPGPLSLGFSRQEYWSGLPLPSPRHACLLSCFSHVQLCATLWKQPTRLLCPQDSLGKNTGVGCHFLLRARYMEQC